MSFDLLVPSMPHAHICSYFDPNTQSGKLLCKPSTIKIPVVPAQETSSRQSRICPYAGAACRHASPSPKTFSDIPREIRSKIYGLLMDPSFSESFNWTTLDGCECIPLGTMNGNVFAQPGSEEAWQQNPAVRTTYIKLISVSRMLRTDLSFWLCSRFPVIIHSSALASMVVWSPRNPLPDVLVNCKRLAIYLAECCPNLETEDHIVHECSPLSRQFSTHLRGWQNLARHLAVSCHPSLMLCLVCAAIDVRMVEAAIAPLRELKLSRCSIMFGDMVSDVSPVMEQSRQVARQATERQTTTSQPFRYLDLPTEIREHILSFTDLVTTSCEVHWEPARNLTQPNQDLGKDGCSWEEFCTKQSDVSYPACRCFRPPIPLFLVCRKMLHDARHIFYSANRFVLRCFDPNFHFPRPPAGSPIEATQFLTQVIPVDHLSSIRDVEIVYPGWRYLNPAEVDAETLVHWASTMFSVAQHTNRMTVAVYLNYNSAYSKDDTPPSLWYWNSLFEMHERIVEPFRFFERLQGFFVFMGSMPTATTEVKQRLAAHEDELERLVMGDEYNSVDAGKFTRKKSRWCDDSYISWRD